MTFYKGQKVRFIGVDTSFETNPLDAIQIEEATRRPLREKPFFVVSRDSIERKERTWVSVEELTFDLTDKEVVLFEEEINYEEIVG
jgi:heat shock protein HspQ